MMSSEEFGRGRGGIRRPPVEVARTVTSTDPDTVQTPPILPPIEQVQRKMTKEVRADTPPIIAIERQVKTGAAERTANKPLDEDLKRARIYGNRPPLEVQNPMPQVSPASTPATDTTVQPTETRRTGAVDRPRSRPVDTQVNTTPPIIAPPVQNRKTDTTQKEERRVEQPRVERPRVETPRRVETPKIESPPPRTETPRTESPRPETPKREEPRSEPKRSEPPPQKSEPKPDKPAPAEAPKKKDGR
jgi:hypothetical protein